MPIWNMADSGGCSALQGGEREWGGKGGGGGDKGGKLEQEWDDDRVTWREGEGVKACSYSGGFDVAISWTVQPRLQMSDLRPYPSPRITSGAIQ